MEGVGLTDVSVDYRLTGSGWSSCTIDIYGQTCVLTASYLSDPLRELVSAMNHMLSGGKEARFSFDEEPGEYRWILNSILGGGLALKILEFPQLWGDKSDAEGRIVLEATCQVRVFAEAVLVSLNCLLEEHGLKGYKETWSNAEFPVDDYRVLCSKLGSIPLTVTRKA
jgi:hypothetical protein